MMLVTFSGLDGAGKSTQVDRTCAALAARGYRVIRLRTLMTSVTGIATLIREARHARRKQPTAPAQPAPSLTAPSPTAPTLNAQRSYAGGRTFDQDRHRRSVQLRRWLIYPMDCLALSFWLVWLRMRGWDAVVCDRYIYDKMVNLPETDSILAGLMRRLTPRPTCAILLDVSTADALNRRGHEHTADYFQTKHAAYQRVLRANPELRAVPTTTVDATWEHIEAAILESAGWAASTPDRTDMPRPALEIPKT